MESPKYWEAHVTVTDGETNKKHVERYLVDATGVTEVEAAVTTEFKDYPFGWKLKHVKASPIIAVLK